MTSDRSREREIAENAVGLVEEHVVFDPEFSIENWIRKYGDDRVREELGGLLTLVVNRRSAHDYSDIDALAGAHHRASRQAYEKIRVAIDARLRALEKTDG